MKTLIKRYLPLLIALLGLTLLTACSPLTGALQQVVQAPTAEVSGEGGGSAVADVQFVGTGGASCDRNAFDQAGCRHWWWQAWGRGQTIQLIAERRNGRDWRAVARLNGLPDNNANMEIVGYIALQVEGIPEVRSRQGRLLGETVAPMVTPDSSSIGGAWVSEIAAATVENNLGMGPKLKTLLAKHATNVQWDRKGTVISQQPAGSIIRIETRPQHELDLTVPNLTLFHCSLDNLAPQKGKTYGCWYLPTEKQVAMPEGVVYDQLLILDGPFRPDQQWSWWGRK